ncbi:MAG: Fe-S cluster assembly protein NifU [Lentisphaerota bacterium]
MWDYNKKVMDSFLNPKNVGEIPDADAIGEVGNIRCGDALKLFIKLDAKKEKIVDVKFKTFGCASAIASSSALTELVKGMTLEQASKVTNKDIVNILGELPEEKLHCSVMGMEALQAAIANFRGEKTAVTDTDHEGAVICKCFGVTDTKIREVAKINNLRKAEEITNYTKAGGGCGCCLDDIQQILDELWKIESKKTPAPPASHKMTTVQKVMKVQEVIDKEIKPMLEKDGGSIELIDIQGDNVLVRLCGRCATCPASGVTLKNTVEDKLREFVTPELTVEEVK